MTKSPLVNIMNKYTPSYKNLNFEYPSKKAIYNSTMNMFDYYGNKKKEAFYMLDYLSGKINKKDRMNIVLENGEYATKEEIEKRKKQYAKYIENSNIYKLVISFPSGYLEQNTDIKKLEKALAKEIIPIFLKKCGFQDIKKMSYQFSLHTDTDNLHFHLSFAEKSPNYKRYTKDKELSYRFAGKLTQEELSFFKNQIEHYIEKDKIYTQLLTKTNKDLDELKKYFNPKDKNYLLANKEDLILESQILKLGKLLEAKKLIKPKRIKFNSIRDKEIKDLTKAIKKQIFTKENTSLGIDYNNFKTTINELNNYFTKLSQNNHIDIVDNTLVKTKEKYLNNYILNAIVNEANNNFKNKNLDENKIIQSIVENNYKKNKKNTRFDIVNNYLSPSNSGIRFKNKYLIMQAVKNINDELEEAEKEFEKLFKENKPQIT